MDGCIIYAGKLITQPDFSIPLTHLLRSLATKTKTKQNLSYANMEHLQQCNVYNFGIFRSSKLTQNASRKPEIYFFCWYQPRLTIYKVLSVQSEVFVQEFNPLGP